MCTAKIYVRFLKIFVLEPIAQSNYNSQFLILNS